MLRFVRMSDSTDINIRLCSFLVLHDVNGRDNAISIHFFTSPYQNCAEGSDYLEETAGHVLK